MMRSRIIIVAGAVSAASLIAEYGFEIGTQWRSLVDSVLIAAFAAVIVWATVADRKPQALAPAFFVVAVLIARPLVEARYGIEDPPTAGRLLDILRVSLVVRIYLITAASATLWRTAGTRIMRILVAHPVRSALVAYAGLVGFAWLVLNMPAMFRPGLAAQNQIDTLVLSVSAVTLTGISTVSVADSMTRMGQLTLAVLVQSGGLLIMVLGAAFWLSVRRCATDAPLDEVVRTLRRVIRTVLVTVVIVELLGTALLFWRLPQAEFSTYTRVFVAAFHAVSAFCNAGFSVYTRGMSPFYADWDIAMVVSGLTFMGGLGLFVMLAVARRPRDGSSGLGGRAGLIVLASLVLVGLGTFAVLRYGPASESGLQALFHSVASRSSGFSMTPVSSLGYGAGAVTMLLMFIGGAPGSMAGGIKITTAVVLGSALLSPTARRWEVRPAVAVVAASAFAVAAGVVLLWLAEAAPFPALCFEAVSAFGTVGFSHTQTALFSISGKLIVIAMMVLGRVLPMIVGLIVYRRASRLPDGTMMVG